MVHFGGAALIIDYGHVESAIGDTLQAVGRHKVAEPLLTPGEVDLTAHVDFQALAQAAEGWARACTVRCRRACCCAGSASRSGRTRSRRARRRTMPRTIQAALVRLTDEDRTGMGRLFKALAVSDPKLEPLPGFDA